MSHKLIIPLIILTLLGLAAAAGFSKGMSYSESKYRAIMQDQRDEINEIRNDVRAKEIEHAKKLQTMEDRLQRNKEQYDIDIVAIADHSTKRLHEAEARIAYYRSIGNVQKTGTSECKPLIRITEAYDRQLTEGIGVVGELRTTAQRVLSDLKTMTKLVELDRQHINN